MQIKQGLISSATYIKSEFCDARPIDVEVALLVIHNISLPPGKFGGPYIDHLFTGSLKPEENEYFEHIYQMRVSAHCLVRRDGSIHQYVPLHQRAWHAGVSSFQGKSKCNDFSIGIEMEGTDNISYTDAQYDTLVNLTHCIVNDFPAINLSRIVGHCDIAPGRKTDPGASFDWSRYRQTLDLGSKD